MNSANYLRHARLSTCIRAVPAGWISVKFDIEDFYEGLSIKFKFRLNRVILAATLPEDLNTCYCLRRHYIAIKALSSSEMVSGC